MNVHRGRRNDGWMAAWLTGWLASCMVSRLAGWLASWLDSWLHSMHRPAGLSPHLQAREPAPEQQNQRACVARSMHWAEL
eukprot:358363-Chlamydomonas_euryale.AAC.4